MPGVSETRTIDAVLTTTLANYRGRLYDNVFDTYPLLSWFNGKLADAVRGEKRKRVVDGGESIIEHVLYEQSSAVKAYSGYETLDLTAQDGMTWARYAWRYYAGTISISGAERRNNEGDAKMIDLLGAKTQQAEMSLRDLLSRHFWGSNASSKDIDGLGVIVDSTGTAGGLSQATFSWWAATETASGSFAAQGLKDMRTLYNTLAFGNDAPDGFFTTQTVFEFYETALQPQERYTDTKVANSGFTNITFKGKPLFFDRDATSGTIHFLNSSYINIVVHKDADMATGKFVEPIDQDATSAKILFQANMTTGNRRMHGKLTGVTA